LIQIHVINQKKKNGQRKDIIQMVEQLLCTKKIKRYRAAKKQNEQNWTEF
jgi:hypothetical protein